MSGWVSEKGIFPDNDHLGFTFAMGNITTVEEYVQFMEDWLTPPQVVPLPPQVGTLDVAHAAVYLDSMWKIKTGVRLFSGFHIAGCARLTQMCGFEAEFDSLTSALGELVGCVVPLAGRRQGVCGRWTP